MCGSSMNFLQRDNTCVSSTEIEELNITYTPEALIDPLLSLRPPAHHGKPRG